MLAVRPVNPPRPSSSSFRPSRSACSRFGVLPLRRWMNDSMAASNGVARCGQAELKLTLLLFSDGGKTLVRGWASAKMGQHGRGRGSVVEVDAHGQQIVAEGAHAEAVELREFSKASVWVVIGHQ